MKPLKNATFRRALVVGAVTAALVAPGAPALADHDGPSPNASCQGILSEANSKHGPPRSEVALFFRDVHLDLGIPPGVVMSAVARAEGDSLNACLASLTEILEALLTQP